MLRKSEPSRAQLLRTVRAGALLCLLSPGVPFLGGFVYAWPGLRQLQAEREALRTLTPADVEAVVVYRDAGDASPLATVTDEAELRELFGAFGRIEDAARPRPSAYAATLRVLIRYRDGRSQQWEFRLKGTADDGLHLNRPARSCRPFASPAARTASPGAELAGDGDGREAIGVRATVRQTDRRRARGPAPGRPTHRAGKRLPPGHRASGA